MSNFMQYFPVSSWKNFDCNAKKNVIRRFLSLTSWIIFYHFSVVVPGCSYRCRFSLNRSVYEKLPFQKPKFAWNVILTSDTIVCAVGDNTKSLSVKGIAFTKFDSVYKRSTVENNRFSRSLSRFLLLLRLSVWNYRPTIFFTGVNFWLFWAVRNFRTSRRRSWRVLHDQELLLCSSR